MASTEEKLWEDLSICPESDALRLILADLLQEPGCSAQQNNLALALRWAVHKQKRPAQSEGYWLGERPWIWEAEESWDCDSPHRLPFALLHCMPRAGTGYNQRTRELDTLRTAYECLAAALAALREILA